MSMYQNIKLIESSNLDDLQKRSLSSHIIQRTYRERKALKPDLKNIVFVEIRGTPKKPVLVFLAEPTYNFRMKIVKFGTTSYQDESEDNGYEILIELSNYDYLRTKYLNSKQIWELDINQFRDLMDFKNLKIKIDCQCMSFHWLGMRYRWSLEKVAIYPTNIPDNVWKFRHNSRTICKHLKGTFQILRFHLPQVLKKIKKKYANKKVKLKPLKPYPMKRVRKR